MPIEPPFLYDPPAHSRNSAYGNGFNPKRVSVASLQPPSPRAQQSGPLLNFNRHPDSYLILPYGNTGAQPMSSSTKNRVKYVRWFQLFLRACELLGAAGILVCAICVRHVDGTMGWILRIPCGVAILHSLYAMYHLSHTSTSKPPTSAASYHLFAAATDAALIPFYAFAALMAQAQHNKPLATPPEPMDWHTVFANPIADGKIVTSIFLFGITNGGLHLASLVLCLYLAIIFRKIAKLPPDMNPLESNLTSRHKKRDSYAVNEKHLSTSSTSTSGSGLKSNRSSTAPDGSPRTIPFMHTRTDSRGPDSVHDIPFSGYTTPPTSSKRNSRADLPSQLQQQNLSRASLSRSTSPPKKRTSYYDLDANQTPSPQQQQLLSDNWFTHSDELRSTAPSVISTVSSIRSIDHRRAAAYAPVPQSAADEFASIPLSAAQGKRLHPLEANPPTPPPPSQQLQYEQENQRELRQQQPHEQPQSQKLGLGLTRQLSGLGRQFSLRKARLYGDVREGTPPVMVGGDGNRRTRVVSRTGMDAGDGDGVRVRQVSGKVVEEGRGGSW